VPVTSPGPEMIPALAREQFPALAREQFPALIADPAVVYLDSAATTQKPRPVIDAVTAELSGA
jgi:cysteine desulfurase/selenocysteine lyase